MPRNQRLTQPPPSSWRFSSYILRKRLRSTLCRGCNKSRKVPTNAACLSAWTLMALGHAVICELSGYLSYVSPYDLDLVKVEQAGGKTAGPKFVRHIEKECWQYTTHVIDLKSGHQDPAANAAFAKCFQDQLVLRMSLGSLAVYALLAVFCILHPLVADVMFRSFPLPN